MDPKGRKGKQRTPCPHWGDPSKATWNPLTMPSQTYPSIPTSGAGSCRHYLGNTWLLLWLLLPAATLALALLVLARARGLVPGS